MVDSLFLPMPRAEPCVLQFHLADVQNGDPTYLVGGFNPSEKYEFVSWDDDIPNIWKNKYDVPNHQPDLYIYMYTSYAHIYVYIHIRYVNYHPIVE
jgi:hypothetical protein